MLLCLVRRVVNICISFSVGEHSKMLIVNVMRIMFTLFKIVSCF